MLTERAPQYAAQAEALLGTKAFYDNEREGALHATGENKLTFTAESAGMRGLLYIRALRLIAQARQEAQNPTHALRPSRLGAFALEHLPEVIDISRQLAVINTAEHTLAEQEASFFGGLRAHQEPYLHDVINFMNMRPSLVTVEHEPGEFIEQYIRGATVEAPTGLGKTVLIARTLSGLGVGRPLENVEHDQGRVRALIIVPSQTIVEQMTGKVGDDTLRRFAPGIDVGGYYQHEKDHDADAVVITIDQFVSEFRNGMLHGQRFDICIIDEAHHATEPLFQKTLLKHWQGGPIIGFTATPQYYPGKDVRDLLPHRIFHGDLLEYIESEDDVLNAAQLFMLRVEHDRYIAAEMMKELENLVQTEIDQLVIREATAEFLAPLIAQSRRGIVFCEQGGGKPSRYAVLMAERLAKLTRPNGTPVVTATAGTLNNSKPRDDPDSNQGIRKRYAEGKVDIITTVEWGREGLNEDIDFVIAASDIISLLKFQQMIGRGTRLSSKFPITIYGHIFVPAMYRNALSLFGVFGLETVEQGKIIGHKAAPEDETPPASGERRVHGLPINLFSGRVQELLMSVHAKTVGEALFHPDVHIHVPREYKRFDAIMAHVPGPPVTIRRYLRDRLGFACIGRYESTDSGREFVFHFEPEAEKYLDTYRGAVARVELQRELGGVDVSIVDAMAHEAGATSLTWFYYDGKRIPHFSKNDATKIRRIFAQTPPAAPTDYNRPKLAAAAGINEKSLKNKLTQAERDQIVPKRTITANGKIRVLDHWTQAEGDAIIERLKELAEAEGVPLYLVQQELAIRHVRTQKRTLEKFADSIGRPTELVRIARDGRPPRCLTWRAIQAAETAFGVRHNDFVIDYEMLPHDRTDKDPARLAYAQSIIENLQSLPTKAAKS